MQEVATWSCQVFAVIRKRNGLPGSHEKVLNERFYCVYDDAEKALQELPEDIRRSFGVYPVFLVIPRTEPLTTENVNVFIEATVIQQEG